MIKCITCHKEYPEEHYVKSTGECRACRNVRARRNYHKRMQDPKNKAKKREQSKAAKNRIKKKLVDYHGGACKDCGGVFHPSVYDFHHLDSSSKDFSVANMSSYESALAESKKCVMLCANCHRIRHWEVSNSNDSVD